MIWQTVLGLLLFTLLFLVFLPDGRLRSAAMLLLQRLLHLVLFVAVAVLFLMTFCPSLLPGELPDLLQADLAPLRSDLPGFRLAERVCGSTWLVVACLLVLVGLPQLFKLALLRRWSLAQRRSRRRKAKRSKKAGKASAKRSRNKLARLLLIKDMLD